MKLKGVTPWRIMLVGIVAHFVGMIWDGYFHSNGGVHSGDAVLPSHALMIIGLAVVLAAAVPIYKELSGPQEKIVGVATALTAAALVTRTYDEYLHFSDIHESAGNMGAHLVAELGFIVVIIAMGVAFGLGKWLPDEVVDGGDSRPKEAQSTDSSR